MNSKTITIFTILFVLFATSVRASKHMRVTAPGARPWKKNGGPIPVSWDCVECSQNEDVVVKIIQIGPGIPVFRGNGKNANTGHLDVPIGKDWDVNKPYFAEVSLRDDPSVSADGVKFTIVN
ncbi:hypothetical protein RclHR1_02280017 [Rhizophagus clarus]|uniref:Uncharacterized protein n=1 Tax=Rhizophagus clarus TaxID=94130 RepID=A0A2Z6R8C8_9GLOM|nr:hypothetical protein RclHR1_02280017 [Rhizophagus clarus]GES75736.1 hypothetical protein GLOIN_2v1606651 [Rhizophagus clarus]